MLRLSRIGLCLSLGLLVSLGACKKGDSKSPGEGTTQEQLDAQREAARKAAMAQGLIGQARKDIEAGNYLSARKRAEEAIAANPKDADAYAVLGAAYWRAGEFDLSTKAYRDGAEIDPESFPVVIGLARNLQAAGEHKEAIALGDSLIALEGKNFRSTSCAAAKPESAGEGEAAEAGGTEAADAEAADAETGGACEQGWCDATDQTCKPNRQVSPRLQKLWSQYLLMDVAAGVKTADELFIGAVGADEAAGQLTIAASYRDFMQAFATVGDLLAIEGDKGSSSLGLETLAGLKYTGTVVGDEFSMTVIQELQNETRIDKDLAKKLGLKPRGKVQPANAAEPLAVVLIPTVKIGDLTIKNVPALIDDLEVYSGIGEKPGLALGRQVLQRLGSVTFDFPARSFEVTAAVPEPGKDVSESPLLFMDTFFSTVPVTRVAIDGSDQSFWAWFGGIYPAVLGITQKAFLKSGKHRPSDLVDPEDPERGLKMVYVDSAQLGTLKVPGVGGLVFVQEPPDAGLNSVTAGAGFELGGYVNFSVIQQWRVTYVVQRGKIYLQQPAAG